MAERWQHLGWVTAAAFAGWLMYELTWTPQIPAPPAPVTDGDPAAAPPGMEGQPRDLAKLRATLERPLFDDDRRPNAVADAAAAAPEPAAPAKAPPVRLSAVIVAADGGRSALLQPDGQEPQRVRQGEQVAGWRVDEISDEAVVLYTGSERSVVPLRVFEPLATKASARPAARKRADTARRPPPKPAAPDAAAPRGEADPRGQAAGASNAEPPAQGKRDAETPARGKRTAEPPSQRKRN